ncbi:2-amino-4-hydroxy-6-hydroxymethyldihydropteridine diphosphokinase [Candidatus Magnetaquicoccus inordinatus]|uniref:2-amino-4-hydroxy-6- hydroxymethyldihydropteridine diphosphokinase n=1 Tax=Candidatus Magnetaquicoccus inordinatus TaxID=2496818 RepID=UPI00187D1A9E|nr:2-amino-4-hydroxy-6-hydroxymethyldihydropteridine diphosphokinase [Candidatus Magnetaquicoccus inordinatus]
MSDANPVAPTPVQVWLGVGSNRGPSHAIFRRLLSRLAAHPYLKLVALSSWYYTEALGPGRQRRYLNAVFGVQTILSPQSLLRCLHRLEASCGRRRRLEKRWGPRRLDLDLLFYGQKIIHNRIIQLPHPRLQDRRFVLQPLAEVAADFWHPQCSKTVDTLLKEVDDTSRVVLVR